MSKIDLTGQTFGKLTVVSLTSERRNSERTWLCRCSCGTNRVVRGSSLRSAGQYSCGCGIRKSQGQAGLTLVLDKYRRTAAKKSLPFELTREEFRALTGSSCNYCGIGPSATRTHNSQDVSVAGKANAAYTYNGLDRVDNNLGYVKNNVVPCCRPCNMAKRTMTLDAFLAWIRRITAFQSSKETKT